MCVIAIKKAGVEMPDALNIQDMWDRNSDGAGFMYAVDGEVIIEKGFMTLRDFNNALAGAEKRLKALNYEVKDVPFVLHFRITTHGGTSAENTHPFPVSPNIKSLQALDVTTDLGMAHNGIIDIAPRSIKLSDTMEYILARVMPLRILNRDFLEFTSSMEFFKDTINGSRLVFLKGDGKIHTIGGWQLGTVEGTKEIYYSNLIHEPYDNSWYYDKHYKTREYKIIDEKVKEVPFGGGYAVVKGDDIVALELLYDTKEQFNGKVRPMQPDMHTSLIDDNKTFKRYIDRVGQVYYRTNYGKKKQKMRVTQSTFWDMLIQISEDGKTYKIIGGKDLVGDYIDVSTTIAI